MAARQLPAASRDSCALNWTCINFSASRKVAAETSGPTGGEVAKAEGAPGGAPGRRTHRGAAIELGIKMTPENEIALEPPAAERVGIELQSRALVPQTRQVRRSGLQVETVC